MAGGAVVVTLIVVAVLVVTGGDQNGGPSPADVATGYLEALARGDAGAALSYSDQQPSTKDLLTDDVLKKQIAKWPITNIRVLNAHSEDANTGRVHIAATFGTTLSETMLHIERKHGRWLLPSAVIALPENPAPDASEQTLTLFGKPFGASRQHVFPGWLDVGSSNPYIAATTQPLLLERLTAREHFLQADFTVNDTGVNTVRDAITAAFAKCEQFHVLKPPYPCSESGLSPDEYVEGTVTWGDSDLSDIKSSFAQRNLAVIFSGNIMTDITAQTRAGASKHFTGQHHAKGVADLTTTPPTLKFG